MSVRLLHLLPQNNSFSRNLKFHQVLTRPVTRIQCIKRDDEDDDIIRNMRIRKPKKKKKIMTDSELAKDLAREIGKANTVAEQRREAMKKSGEILWGEFCRHMELKEDEMKIKWSKIGEEEKVVLVREFVDEWAVDFQPLSVRSVKEMVEQECLDSSMESSASMSSFSGLFPGLKRIIGFE
ncbi:unnamed protein product [Arabidopsis lyrata]|uniref:DUF7026 domain-containing protein n=1 Tax=Arabidopsis lyrata subsp. lyrata TaxID=81972 RepID=D7MRU4_ARALL|nr:uncharacterized protein LOC9300979 [Arabidopsis lyrata subsp. lyrata]EFH41163.1 hypothetical protein ARALYDRAFT_496659 [Arabidopsis lyrata subsp. lyrata]CAH8280793.1 unnamed protein product [Arabidopsis lyrata]|eukprot:XP_002864904.1 uncharacterized protein LOC9300979 [Arabidopsis lyrata subsp. lyrata]